MSRRPGPAVLLLAVLSSSCSPDSGPADTGVSRDTLPNGAVVLGYPPLPAREVVPDLRLGAVEADPMLNFADVRGIDAGSDGTIYVLDYQLSEVRAFDAVGKYLRTVATPGEGPGELSEANGFILVGDSILWIQDHGKWAMIGVSTEGEEVGRYPMPVRSYSYMWSGTIDDRGRVWKPESHYDGQPAFPPELGFSETEFRGYWKWYDPATEIADSVYVGDGRYRGHVSRNRRGGWSHREIPHLSSTVSAVDPAGGFWQVDNAAYRIARLDERGDTVLVIESYVTPLPVTDVDRSAYIDEVLENDEDARAAAEEIVSAMPEVKPVIESLVVDDRGRLWVDRVVPRGETPLYDVFERDGNYPGSVRLGFEPNAYLPIRVRHGHMYALVRDELDIPFVVRADVPALIGATEVSGPGRQ